MRRWCAVQRRRGARGTRLVGGVPQQRARPGATHGDVSIAIIASALIGSVRSPARWRVASCGADRGRRSVSGPKFGNLGLLALVVARGAIVAVQSSNGSSWRCFSARSLFGVLFVLPIGGADMPVVISL